MAEKLPDKLVVPTRADLIAQFLADVRWRAPNTGIADGQLANIDAAVIADMLLPVYGEAVRQDAGLGLDDKEGAALEQVAVDRGLPARLPATGAAGFVIPDVGTGGAFIPADTICKHKDTGAQYRVVLSKLYLSGDPVPVVGITTGPSTNQAALTVLQWVSPPAGLGINAQVFRNSDGSGLYGGHEAETEQALRARIRASTANPAVSGNDAAYQLATQQTPGVAVQAAFTYPCIAGPGTTSVVFLLRPTNPGDNRVPNATQVALARAWVTGQMPKDDTCSWATITTVSVTPILKVRWAQTVAAWLDGVTWPPYDADTYVIDGPSSPGGAPSPTAFAVKSATGSPVTPQAGQSIALFDRTALKWRRKTILSVTGAASPWTITVDTTNGASDTSYTPADLDPVSPWSDSLDLLTLPVASYFDTLGPGEELNTLLGPFYDEGYRQRRSPVSPQFWPSVLTSHMVRGVEDLAAVESVTVASPAIPVDTPGGTAGTVAKLYVLGQMAVYAA